MFAGAAKKSSICSEKSQVKVETSRKQSWNEKKTWCYIGRWNKYVTLPAIFYAPTLRVHQSVRPSIWKFIIWQRWNNGGICVDKFLVSFFVLVWKQDFSQLKTKTYVLNWILYRSIIKHYYVAWRLHLSLETNI